MTNKISDALFLDILKFSINADIRFSNTAITVEKLAKIINRKKKDPHTLPYAIFINTFGNVRKIKEGPESGWTPKLKQAGKMISPDISATNVSNTQIQTDSLTNV